MTTEPLENRDASGPSASRTAAAVPGMPWLTRGRVERLVKFGLVGVTGVAVNLGIFELCYRAVLSGLDQSMRLFVANGAGLVVSIFTNFILNDVWTWGDRLKGNRRDWFGRLIKYYVSASVAGGVQLLVAWASFEFVLKGHSLEVSAAMPGLEWLPLGAGTVDLSPTLSVLTGIAFGMSINFLASHLWAFSDAEVEESA